MRFENYLEEKLKDPAFAQEYEALEPEFAVARAILAARQAANLTQTELAERMGVSPSVLSRMERAAGSSSVKTLWRVAQALNADLRIEFAPREAPPGGGENPIAGRL
jgi:transcriptional regulator with XRE-family HTH domain